MIATILVSLAALTVFWLGCWATRPVPPVWRWVARGLLAAVLLALLTPASAVNLVQNWVKGWLPLAASASSAPGADWVVHVLSFAALGALLFHLRRDISAAAIAAGLIGLGAVTELLQHFVEGRSAALGDLVADCVGASLGYLVAQAARWRF